MMQNFPNWFTESLFHQAVEEHFIMTSSCAESSFVMAHCKCSNCHSFLPLCNPDNAPLGQDAILLMKLLEEKMGHCTMSGGAVLAQMQHQVHCCKNCLQTSKHSSHDSTIFSDVDFFVPVHPLNLKGAVSAKDLLRTSWMCFLCEVLPLFNWHMRNLNKGNLVPVQDGKEVAIEPDVPDCIPESGSLRDCCEAVALWNRSQEGQSRIICKVVDMQHQSKLGSKSPGDTFQLVFLGKSMLESQSWADFAIEGFDIDIVKNSVNLIPSLIDPAVWVPQPTFTNEAAFISFQLKSFVFTVRSATSFAACLKRLKKHLHKGCRPTAIIFDSDVTPAWRWHWMGCCHSLFAHHWSIELLLEAVLQSEKMLGKRNSENQKMLHDFRHSPDIGSVIQSFLWQPPDKRMKNAMSNHARNDQTKRNRSTVAHCINKCNNPAGIEDQ